MALDQVRRTAYYRRARFSEGVTHNLQQLLATAMHDLKRIKDRLETVSSLGQDLRVISSHSTSGGFICGRLTAYERGAYQAVMDDDEDATTLPLHALEPPKKGATQQQFVPGILYFVVHKNHVAISQTSGLRASGLEQHLLWLLRSRLQALTTGQGMVLMDEPTKATRDKIRKSHVKSVMIGRPLMNEEQIPGRTGKGSTRFQVSNQMLEFLRGFIDNAQAFERLGLDDKVFDGNLEIWLEIRYPKHQRSKPARAMRLLDDLGIALRDIDEDQARLRLADGSVVHGKELKIMTHVETTMTRGLLDESTLYDGMRSWVRSLIANGNVEPN